MKAETFARLLELATHDGTPDAERIASMGRILASPVGLGMLRSALAAEPDTDLRKRYDANAESLTQAIRTIVALRQQLADLQSKPSPRSSSGSNGRSRGRARINWQELDEAQTCRDCGADLEPGDLAKVYPNGAVYGKDCHTSARRAS